MLNRPTLDKLYALRLAALAEAWAAQQKDANMASAGFDERLALLVDAEYIARENRRVSRNLKQAKLRISDACLEDVQTSARRGLDRARLRQLGSCTCTEHTNVLINGATGVGKSYLACALGQAACRKGYRWPTGGSHVSSKSSPWLVRMEPIEAERPGVAWSRMTGTTLRPRSL